jgi:hypothetical protein
MKKGRKIYFVLTCCVILLGLISRQISFVPLFIGDILWAIMIFFIIRFIFIDTDIRVIGLISLMLCYMVEISQLYQAEWINNIRKTLPGKLILGQGFLWSDIFSYTVGIIIGTCFEKVKN